MKKKEIKQYLLEILLVVIPTFILFLFCQKISIRYPFITTIIIFIILQFLFIKNINKKHNIGIIIISLFYSLLYLVGTIIKYHSLIELNVIFLFLLLIGVLITIYQLLTFIFYIEYKNNKDNNKINNVFLKSFIILIICYIPYLLIANPGLLSSDSISQVYQALNIEPLNNHHPVIHTLLIKICLLLTNNSMKGITLYSIVQLVIMALVIGYLLSFIYNKTNNRKLLIITSLFYILLPIFGIYSVTIWKDVLFASFILLFMIQLYKLLLEKNYSLLDKILLFISVILTGLFRSNGRYIIILLSIVLLIAKRNIIKNILLLIVLPTLLSLLIVGPIFKSLNINNPSIVESLSIPLGQISSIVKKELPMDKEDTDYLNNLIGIEEIKKSYNSDSIDPIKFNTKFNKKYLEDNKKEFFSIWFKYLLKYPKTYIETYLKSTYGFWYLESTGYDIHAIKIEDNNINLKTNNPSSLKNLENYFVFFTNIPIIRYLLKPAFYILFLIYIMFISIYKYKKEHLLVLLIPFLVWLTAMIATPVFYQTRYVFSLFITFPLVLLVLLETNPRNTK